jgi:hypothetical protein
MGERMNTRGTPKVTPKALPPVPRELVDFLDKAFPDRCPDISVTEKDVWFTAGQVSVVRKLKQILAQHEQNIVEESIIR